MRYEEVDAYEEVLSMVNHGNSATEPDSEAFRMGIEGKRVDGAIKWSCGGSIRTNGMTVEEVDFIVSCPYNLASSIVGI